MTTYITIDGGTSNTRVSLVQNNTVCDSIKLSLGARAGITQKEILVQAVRQAIVDLLAKNNLIEADVTCVLASGMITSEFGLCSLPHITVPAGIRELHDTMHRIQLPEITSIPFVFIRGVRQSGATLNEIDIMRGEETELIGLIDHAAENSLFVLPGSHSKLILTDESGRITSFKTMLTGEMIYALSQNTILKDVVDLSVDQINDDYLHQGYEYARKNGLNEALFKVRVLKIVGGHSKEQMYSFFLGAVLSDEICAIVQSDVTRVVIGGRKQIRLATAQLLRQFSDKTVCCLTDEQVERSVSNGMIRIYEYAH